MNSSLAPKLMKLTYVQAPAIKENGTVMVRNAWERAKYSEHPTLRRLTGALLISMASALTFWFSRRPPQWKVSK
jgi:hypothetical protein